MAFRRGPVQLRDFDQWGGPFSFSQGPRSHLLGRSRVAVLVLAQACDGALASAALCPFTVDPHARGPGFAALLLWAPSLPGHPRPSTSHLCFMASASGLQRFVF